MTQERISTDEALELLTRAPLAELCGRADAVRRARHGGRTHFVHSLNVNPTNVCENRCELCAFWREPEDDDAYVMTAEQARDRMREAAGLGLTDLHVVGGLDARVDLAFYESFMRSAREILPGALIQGMTAVEIRYLADRSGTSVADVLSRLGEAGMDTLSGGGAEIFADRVRGQICPHKIPADQWLAVHEQAHAMGMVTNATVLFGHVETPEEIVDHLARLRALQDRTGGFRALIPLPFHPSGTKAPVARGPGGYTVARVVALSRVFLDNVPHVRVLANYMDRKLLGVLARAGADDLGGTNLAERIARAAGAKPTNAFATAEELSGFIADLGLDPVLTNSRYDEVRGMGVSPVSCSGQGRDAHATSVSAVEEALDQIAAGGRVSAAQAVTLLDRAPLWDLCGAADAARRKTVGGEAVTYVLDRNINVTNVCEAGCRFCAFQVPPGSPDGYVLPVDEVVAKVVEAAGLGATQILIQGGLNPALDLAFYEGMFRAIKAASPDICLHSLSPAEVQYLSRGEGLTVSDTLARLREAGLDSLPGGGAEILVDAVRQQVSPNKIAADDWFAVMAAAQKMGMRTTATMVYGLGETPGQLIEHLIRVRELQDRLGGFTAFIPWSLQAGRTELTHRPKTGADYLRVLATARLVLDNVPHIQAGWVTEGPDVAQLALACGADDFGGILMEERVVRAAGCDRYHVTADDVAALIRETGAVPRQRTTQYEPVEK